MKGKQTALMPGSEDGIGYWLTPPDVMARLQAEFHFDFDACPYPRPAGFDGLKEPWGKMTWVNPPFARTSSMSRSAWVNKMLEERILGNGSVLIFPVDRWLCKLVDAGAEFRVPEPFKYLNPRGHEQKSMHPQLLFILRPK